MLLIFIVLAILITSFLQEGLSKLVGDTPASHFYRRESYSGIVTDKFIDKENHNYHTLIIDNGEQIRRVTFDHEIGGFYEFVEVGDSIFKEPDTLDLRLVRKELDTLIRLNIYDWKE